MVVSTGIWNRPLQCGQVTFCPASLGSKATGLLQWGQDRIVASGMGFPNKKGADEHKFRSGKPDQGQCGNPCCPLQVKPVLVVGAVAMEHSVRVEIGKEQIQVAVRGTEDFLDAWLGV